MDSPAHQKIADKHNNELDERRRRLGMSHPDVAETLNVLGLFYHHVVGDMEKALDHHLQALNILRSQEGNLCHVEMAVTLADIGNVYRSMNDREKAMSAYEQAMEIFREAGISESHPAVLGTIRSVRLIQRGLM